MFCPVLHPQHVTEYYFNIVCGSKSTLWGRFESPGTPFIISKLPSKAPQPVWVGGCARGSSDADRALVALGQGCWWPDEVKPGNVGTTSHQNPTTHMANSKVHIWWDTGSNCTSKGRSWQFLLALPRSVLLFLKKCIILHPHPQTLPPAISVKFSQNTVRNHKKKAGQMFSCIRVSGWERHVLVALFGGYHWGQFAPRVCFGSRMLL